MHLFTKLTFIYLRLIKRLKMPFDNQNKVLMLSTNLGYILQQTLEKILCEYMPVMLCFIMLSYALLLSVFYPLWILSVFFSVFFA